MNKQLISHLFVGAIIAGTSFLVGLLLASKHYDTIMIRDGHAIYNPHTKALEHIAQSCNCPIIIRPK